MPPVRALEICRHPGSDLHWSSTVLLSDCTLSACIINRAECDCTSGCAGDFRSVGVPGPGHPAEDPAKVRGPGAASDPHKWSVPLLVHAGCSEIVYVRVENPCSAAEVLWGVLHLPPSSNIPLLWVWDLCGEVWPSLPLDRHLYR